MKTKNGLTIPIFLLISGLAFSSCQNLVRSENLALIEISMSKQEVQKSLQSIGRYVFCKIDENQKTNEILEFIDWSPFSEPVYVWFYFIDNSLIKYGRPIDFQDNVKRSSLELKVSES